MVYLTVRTVVPRTVVKMKIKLGLGGLGGEEEEEEERMAESESESKRRKEKEKNSRQMAFLIYLSIFFLSPITTMIFLSPFLDWEKKNEKFFF